MSSVGLLKVWKNWLPLAILFWMQAGVPPVLSGPDPTGLDRLRQRVNAYLEALHAGRVDQAAQYVLPASRETVGAAQAGKARVLSFRILEVELEEGNGSALVTVSRTVMTASMMSGRMPVKQRLRWKLREGEWYVDPADPPQTYAALVKEYYYDKLAARANPKPGPAPRRWRWSSSRRSSISAGCPREPPSSPASSSATWPPATSWWRRSMVPNG